LGFFKPERERRTARAMARIASSCEMTARWSSASICSRRSASPFSSRVTGTPVMRATVSAMTSSSTVPSTSLLFARHCRCSSSRDLRILSAWSRR
jgi:hypothetical protein